MRLRGVVVGGEIICFIRSHVRSRPCDLRTSPPSSVDPKCNVATCQTRHSARETTERGSATLCALAALPALPYCPLLAARRARRAPDLGLRDRCMRGLRRTTGKPAPRPWKLCSNTYREYVNLRCAHSRCPGVSHEHATGHPGDWLRHHPFHELRLHLLDHVVRLEHVDVRARGHRLYVLRGVWRALLHTTTTEHLGLRGVQRAVAWALACSAARLTLHPALSSLTTPLACTAPCTPRRTTSSGRE